MIWPQPYGVAVFLFMRIKHKRCNNGCEQDNGVGYFFSGAACDECGWSPYTKSIAGFGIISPFDPGLVEHKHGELPQGYDAGLDVQLPSTATRRTVENIAARKGIRVMWDGAYKQGSGRKITPRSFQ